MRFWSDRKTDRWRLRPSRRSLQRRKFLVPTALSYAYVQLCILCRHGKALDLVQLERDLSEMVEILEVEEEGKDDDKAKEVN